jgi:Cdc6-like AAA superfamily ATPase
VRSRRGITNNYDTPALITDARDLPSFHPVGAAFPPYDATQLRDILEYRVEQAFYPNALSNEVIRYALPWPPRETATPVTLLICYQQLLTFVKKKVDHRTEEDVRVQNGLQKCLCCREVVRLSTSEGVAGKRLQQRGETVATEVYREFNNIMRLRGREQVSHKTLSALIAELEL